MSVVCRYDKDEPHRIPEEEAIQTQRFQGGDYRRPGRWYRTTICRKDALFLVSLEHPPTHAGATIEGYGYQSLRRALGLHDEKGGDQ